MPFLWPIVSGVAVTLLLNHFEAEIPAFIWFWILIALMFWWPAGAAWFLILTVGLIGLVILGAMWEYVLGVILGCFMFFMFVLAFLTAIR